MNRHRTIPAALAVLAIGGAGTAQAGEYRPHNVEVPACDRTDLVGFVPGRAIAGTLTTVADGRIVESRRVSFTGPSVTYALPVGLTGEVVVTFSDGRESWASDPRTCTLEPGPAPAPVPPGEEVPGAPPAAGKPPVVLPPPDAPRRPTPPPRYRVTKRGPLELTTGAAGVYVIRVRNTGRVALRNVRIADRLPAGLALRAVPKGADLVRGSIVWRIPRIGVGRTVARRVPVVAVNTGGRRIVCNTATVTVRGGSSARRARACTRIRIVVRVPRVAG